MSIFKKKKEEPKTCSCENGCAKEVAGATERANTEGAAVKILGGGCAKCNQLEENTLDAMRQLGLGTEIEHVKDYSAIAAYGVMTTPALVYNGKVLSYGKVLKADEIAELLQMEI